MAAIPGAEKYVASETLDESNIAPDLTLHEVAEELDIDQVTFEVLRHRLWQINDEQGITLKNVSGSPVATDANDFNVAMTDERGNVVSIGPYVLFHAGPLDMMVKWILEHRSEDGIEPGDMFFCNDPWIGIVHQNDAAVVAPVFHEGELFAWTSSIVHQVDVGGVHPGSFCITAEDIYAEAQPTPPIKIVQDDELIEGVEDSILRRSRAGPMVGMDLRAQIAANNVAKDRLKEQIDQYGADTVKGVMHETMDYAEESFRNRLRELPDGVWRHVDYQEMATANDRGVYKAELEVEVSGNRLLFRADGDPQTGMLNCTYGCLRGGLMSGVLPLLCYDIPWALGGLYRAIEIEAADGTMINADFPGGSSMGPTAAGWVVKNMSTQCLSKMLVASEEYDEEAMAGVCGSWNTIVMMGLDQRADPFVTMLMDPMAGGWGARVNQDGINTAGQLEIPRGQVPNMELNEHKFPMLYLYRRETTDSGGAGEYRGGVGANTCFIPHGTDAPITHVIAGFGAAVPTTQGIIGGYPANAARYEMIRGSDIHELLEGGVIPRDRSEIEGSVDLMPPKHQTEQGFDDVYYCHWQGGGGFGDPLDRAPEKVAADVVSEYVSVEEAEATYGVVLEEDGTVDDVATVERRDEIRADRLSNTPWGADR